ncbi:hypothetical protein AJ78_05003 [Emergomyces pasteurianus Ep9510]|uniref:HNH nuclease domain-containing protein n=1 Tax=Emergomyces pasteurianus Ep9510 TaxID=1447872 RepID=A0A1J9QEW6_9EURO|nr:hypothetical protein AJ78_05003 [Emergomyces pasteurianus Ep9510]
MSSRPPVPIRTSSKRHLDELKEINESLQKKRRKLHPKGSFNAEYWSTAVDVVSDERRRNSIRKQVSIDDFKATGGTEEEWANSEQAHALLVEEEVLKLKEARFREQCQRLHPSNNTDSTDSPSLALRRSYLELFLSSKRGLGVVSGSRKRENEIQSTFRGDLITAYNAQSSTPHLLECIWCPVLSTWIHESCAIASHIFGYKHGQQTMDAIFGKMEQPELFHPKNGLMLSSVVESKFNSGLFAIVPNLPDRPSPEEIAQWQESEPKDYKLRIIDRDPVKLNMSTTVPGIGTTWKDLDGKKLDFRSDFRPRARYLYYHYCLQILRVAFRERFEGEIIREKELQKPFWGSPGKYVRKNMLQAFVEEVGHKYDGLLKGASDESSEGQGEDDLMLLAATRDVDLSLREKGVTIVAGETCEEEDEDDDEEEEEEEYKEGDEDEDSDEY